MMLGKQILGSQEKDSDNNVSKLESKRKLIMKWTPPREKHLYFKHRYGSPRMISRSFPQRKKSLSYYKTNNFSTIDISVKGDASVFASPKSSLENSFNRELSRSAKIMRALSSSSEFLSHRHRNIRKSLNFSPSPSPQKRNSCNSSIRSDSSSPMFPEKLMLDSTSTDSSASMLIASTESIDENQNQTPQHSQKITNTLTDTTPRMKKNADTELSKFKLRSRLKERIDNIVSNAETPKNTFSKSNIGGCVVLASTPREASQEISQDEHNRSHISENIMIIPQTMSAIKKSHKKEKLHYFEDLLSTRQMEVSNANLLTNTTTKSLELHDASDSFYSVTPIKESQKKKKVVKKMLTYKDSGLNFSDTRSLLMDHDTEKIAPSEDSSGSRSDKIQNDKVQNIDLNDHDAIRYKKPAQYNDRINCNDKKEDNDCFKKDNSKKEEPHSSSSQELSRTRTADATNEKRAVSPERESTSSQSNNTATTPENHINLLKHICTESIKKSHKKVKYEKRKALSQAQGLHQKMEIDKSEASAEDIDIDQHKDTSDKTTTTTLTLTRQNFDRPGTPENLNSSRLLLSQFNSVKKSHKKDKEKKEKMSSVIKHREYSKIHSNWLEDYRDGETSCNALSQSNKSLQLRDSPDVLLKKGKRSLRMSLRGSVRKSKDADDEFKIYTPIKRRPLILLGNSGNTKPQEKDKSAETTPKEIDCFRCTTPVARHCEDITPENSKELEAHSSNNGLADIGNQTRGSGASTPTNMSTAELRHNIDSIKASHKKEKFDRSGVCRKQILGKKQQYNETIKNISFADMTDMSEGHSVENNVGYAKTGTCSNTYGEDVDKNREGVSYETFAIRAENSIESANIVKESNSVVATPPNDSKVAKFIRLSHTTSIKKSHKKERDNKAQAKYIFMSEEHDLSDDGSIFNEEDRLNSAEFLEDLCHDNEMTNSI